MGSLSQEEMGSKAMKGYEFVATAAIVAASLGIALAGPSQIAGAQEGGVAAKSATKLAAKPTTKSTTKPAAKPMTKPAAKPMTKPAAKPPTKEATKRAVEVLRSCAPCHDLTAARKKRISVPVFGLYGAKPAKASIKIAKWDDRKLNAFLENPKKVDPNSRMSFKVKDPKKRAEIIAAMKTLK